MNGVASCNSPQSYIFSWRPIGGMRIERKCLSIGGSSCSQSECRHPGPKDVAVVEQAAGRVTQRLPVDAGVAATEERGDAGVVWKVVLHRQDRVATEHVKGGTERPRGQQRRRDSMDGRTWRRRE